MSVTARLTAVGLQLPEPPRPLGGYVPAVEASGLLFLSGLLPLRDGRPAVTGRLGAELDLAAGRDAARVAALNALAVIRAETGLDAGTRSHRGGVVRRKCGQHAGRGRARGGQAPAVGFGQAA